MHTYVVAATTRHAPSALTAALTYHICVVAVAAALPPPGAISPRDATDYAAYQRRCAANMDWDCLGRHHRKMLRAK
jgi:hypothetical protein